MTNLKRVLSLALAAVMLMGMMVIGAGAANIEYTDAADIENDVAVAVLTGMDVLGGYPDGSFKPEGTLTRAEAAAVICRIMLGANVAESLSTSTAPFADVKATNWAAGYIAYLKNLGVISGIGNNKFNPQGTVTVGEFAKMLLGAAGVDGQYTGTNWLINVTVAAQQAKILSNKDVVTADATRDAVAGYTLNALNYTPDGETSEYVVKNAGGTVLYRGNDAITALLMKQADATNTLTVETTNAGSLGATVFGLKKGTKIDEFGRKSVTYTNGETGKDEVVYATIAPEAKLTYTTATTYGKIVSALGYTKTSEKVTLNVYDNTATVDTKNNIDRTNATAIGGQGVLVQVYANGTDNYDVVVVDTHVKKLTAGDIVAAKAATSTTDAQPAYIKLEGSPSSASDNGAYETDAFKADDVVLYTKADGKIVNVVKADYITGYVTATASGYFRVDGTQKYLSENSGLTIGSGVLTISNTQDKTFYLDAYGNVIYAENGKAAAVDTSYIYVIDTAAKKAETGTGDNLFEQDESSAARAQAKVIDLATGEVKIVNLGIVKGTDGKYYYASLNGSASATEVTNDKFTSDTGIFECATLADGSIALKATKETGASVTVEKGKADLTGGKYANSNTVLTVVEYTTDKDGAIVSASVTKSTGIANFPAASTTYTGAIVTADTNGIASSILVVKAKETVAAANYAIYKGEGETTADGTMYEFYVNGEVVAYYKDAGVTGLTADKVYNLSVTNGKITAAPVVNPVTDGSAVKVTYVDSTYAIAGGHVFYFADGCKVVDKDAEYAVDTLAVDDTITLYGKDANSISLIVIDNP